jgi:hypothetical protein
VNDDVSGGEDFQMNDEFVAENVYTGRGETLEDALSDAAAHALRRHPEGTRFEISMISGAIHNPHVSDYRVILTK